MMTFSEKMYRVLLGAYPRDYRRRYREPMEQLFRDRLREVRSFADLAALWRQTLVDWIVSVPARHWEELGPHRGGGPLAKPARRCLFFARFEASSFSRSEITVEHLLLGVLRETPSLVREGAVETIVRAIEASEPAGRRLPSRGNLRLSDGVMRVISAATDSASAAGRNVSPADFARAISRETDGLAVRLLREYIST